MRTWLDLEPGLASTRAEGQDSGGYLSENDEGFRRIRTEKMPGAGTLYVHDRHSMQGKRICLSLFH